MRNFFVRSVVLSSVLVVWGCGSNGGSNGSGGAPGTGGSSKPGTGGSGSGGATSGSGGASQSGGSPSTGGATGSGGASNGGAAGAGAGGAAGSSAGTTGTSTSAGGTAGSNSGGTSGGGNSGGGSGTTPTGGAGGGDTGAVTVKLDATHQTIDGFGINDTWGSVLSDAQAKEMFDESTGIGLSILRVGMSPSGGFYNGDESSRIALAKKYGVTKIIGSVWSPPGNCKDNGKTTDGGHLLQSCYGSWSDSIANFAKSNNLYAMSAGNEGDFASCGSIEPCNGSYDTTLFTANEMVAFVKVLGPKLKAAGVKLMSPESSEWIHLWSNASATGSVPSNKNSSDPLKCGCFSNTPTTTGCASKCTTGDGYDYGHFLAKDATAWAAIDIIGIHQYDTQKSVAWPSDVPDKKPIWQTEMSGVKWWPDGTPSSDINNGVAVAGWLHDALTVGEANAWLWWWYKATGDTNEGLFLANGTDTKRHYTFGNFTKFIRPGYVRVDVTGAIPKDVLLSAYKGTDGTVVVVAINKGTAAASVPISISGTAPASMTPTVTSATDNLKSGAAVTVTGGTFTAALPSMTVTTFVGK